MSRIYVHRQCQRTIMKWQIYNGFLIEIINNHTYHPFMFEYVLTPLSLSAKARTWKRFLKKKWQSPDGKVYDPTSTRSVGYAYVRAKMAVNQINSPFWLHPWHD